MGKRTVRLRKHRSPLIDLVYPGLADVRREVVATIKDREYHDTVLGLRYGDISAWIYERDVT